MSSVAVYDDWSRSSITAFVCEVAALAGANRSRKIAVLEVGWHDCSIPREFRVRRVFFSLLPPPSPLTKVYRDVEREREMIFVCGEFSYCRSFERSHAYNATVTINYFILLGKNGYCMWMITIVVRNEKKRESAFCLLFSSHLKWLERGWSDEITESANNENKKVECMWIDIIVIMRVDLILSNGWKRKISPIFQL